MLEKISKILYVFLSSLFVLAVIIYLSKGKIFLDTKIFYIVFLLVLPFIDIFIESIKKSFTFSNLSFNHEDNPFKYIWLGILWIILHYNWVDLKNISVLLFLAFSLLFKLDSRISFIWALFLLIITPLYLIIGDKSTAESVSILAYYLLIIWVVLEIKNQIFDKTENLEETKNTNIAKKSPSTQSFFDEVIEIILEYVESLKAKIGEIKNNILEDIWEWADTKKEIIEKNIVHKESTKEKAQELITNTKQNFYVKLFSYFIKKAKENVLSITLFLFTLNVILVVLVLWYSSVENVLFYFFSLLLISYCVSKILWVTYNHSITKTHNVRGLSNSKLLSKKVTIEDAVLKTQELSEEDIENISATRNFEKPENIRKRNKFFINKAIIFASFGLLSWYLLLKYFKINENWAAIYVWTFSLFFLAYYATFSDLDSRLLWRSKKTGALIWNWLSNFSIKEFFRRHIYLLLNLILIFSILILLWFKTWIFADLYKNYKEKVGYENWTLTPEAILKNETAEKIKIGETLRPTIDVMSQEVKVNELEEVEIKTEVKNIADIYTFTQTLSEWSVGEEVEILEWFMNKLGYFNKEADTIFDTETKEALTNLLQTECGWPDSTRWIFGNLATQCLYTLDVEIEVTWEAEVSWESIIPQSEIISNEVQIIENQENQNTENTDNTQTEIVQEELENSSSENSETTLDVKKITIGEAHTFASWLSTWDRNEDVQVLEWFMKQLGYFTWETDTTFDEETRLSLTDLLKTECGWPESTRWILWNQALQCVYSLEIDSELN